MGRPFKKGRRGGWGRQCLDAAGKYKSQFCEDFDKCVHDLNTTVLPGKNVIMMKTSPNVCKARSTCSHGTGGLLVDTPQERCQSCDTDYTLTNDKQCVPTDQVCRNGTPKSSVTGKSQQCKTCDDGYTLTNDKQCVPTDQVCRNGTPKSSVTGKSQQCKTCDDGYTLTNDKQCVPTDQVCRNGTPKSSVTGKSQQCKTCDDGYTLSFSSTAIQSLGDEDIHTYPMGEVLEAVKQCDPLLKNCGDAQQLKNQFNQYVIHRYHPFIRKRRRSIPNLKYCCTKTPEEFQQQKAIDIILCQYDNTKSNCAVAGLDTSSLDSLLKATTDKYTSMCLPNNCPHGTPPDYTKENDGENSCKSCNAGYILTNDNQCVSNNVKQVCENGYAFDRPCEHSFCTWNNDALVWNACKQCKPGFSLKSNTCEPASNLENCLGHEFEDGDTCIDESVVRNSDSYFMAAGSTCDGGVMVLSSEKNIATNVDLPMFQRCAKPNIHELCNESEYTTITDFSTVCPPGKECFCKMDTIPVDSLHQLYLRHQEETRKKNGTWDVLNSVYEENVFNDKLIVNPTKNKIRDALNNGIDVTVDDMKSKNKWNSMHQKLLASVEKSQVRKLEDTLDVIDAETMYQPLNIGMMDKLAGAVEIGDEEDYDASTNPNGWSIFNRYESLQLAPITGLQVVLDLLGNTQHENKIVYEKQGTASCAQHFEDLLKNNYYYEPTMSTATDEASCKTSCSSDKSTFVKFENKVCYCDKKVDTTKNVDLLSGVFRERPLKQAWDGDPSPPTHKLISFGVSPIDLFWTKRYVSFSRNTKHFGGNWLMLCTTQDPIQVVIKRHTYTTFLNACGEEDANRCQLCPTMF